MSAPETLRGFLDFARDFAPADSTGLIFWDHGYGPPGGLWQRRARGRRPPDPL